MLREALSNIGKGQVSVEKLISMLDDGILQAAVKMAERSGADSASILKLLQQHLITQVK